MVTIKYTVTYYQGIGECPMVILLDAEKGKFKRQYNTIDELKSDITENAIIYFVADYKTDERIEDLSNWSGGMFDFNKLSDVSINRMK
jgi:hypothetical protein